MVETPGIQLEHIHFRIGGFAMQDLSLSVPKGEYYVLTGPNGSGKTVLVKLVAGLHRPLSGTIRILGESVVDLPPWRRNIGYMPQDGLLFPNRTVAENIRFGLEVRGADKRRIAEASARLAAMLGVEHLMGRRPAGLSGGERQRAALARALVYEPRVLLLDEPVSAIDEASRDDLCRELRQVQRTLGITVVHVSHNRKETGLVADRVGFIEGGVLQDTDHVRSGDHG